MCSKFEDDFCVYTGPATGHGPELLQLQGKAAEAELSESM